MTTIVIKNKVIYTDTQLTTIINTDRDKLYQLSEEVLELYPQYMDIAKNLESSQYWDKENYTIKLIDGKYMDLRNKQIYFRGQVVHGLAVGGNFSHMLLIDRLIEEKGSLEELITEMELTNKYLYDALKYAMEATGMEYNDSEMVYSLILSAYVALVTDVGTYLIHPADTKDINLGYSYTWFSDSEVIGFGSGIFEVYPGRIKELIDNNYTGAFLLNDNTDPVLLLEDAAEVDRYTNDDIRILDLNN